MTTPEVAAALERAYRHEWATVLATLTRHVGGDLELAEEAVADAFVAATADWQRRGVPRRPGAWLTVAARRRAIDRIRHRQVRAAHQPALEHLERLARLDAHGDTDLAPGSGAGAYGDGPGGGPGGPGADDGVADDRLRMIFTCCHPALSLEARLALTLRALGGLDVPQLARAFLTTETAMYQRLVRAKRKVVTAGIPYRVPSADQLPERLAGVRHVVYVMATEGHTASSGDELVHEGLAEEATRLARLLTELVPDDAETLGLLALLLLTDARRPARTDAAGDPVSLEDQDRSRWDRALIAEGVATLEWALSLGVPGPYQVQAAVAALHAEAPSYAGTDWPQVAELYAELERHDPSPVVRVHRAAAVGVEHPAAGLELLAALDDDRMARYQPYWAVRAELLARTGAEPAEAVDAYRRALGLTANRRQRAALAARARRRTGEDLT